MWSTILGFISKPITSYIEGKQARQYMKTEGALEIKKAEVGLKIAEFKARADRLALNDARDSDYDLAAQREKRHSLADEFLILCTVALVIFTFIYPTHMAEGWAAISAGPWWLEFIIIGIYTSVFGLMRLLQVLNPMNKVKK